MPSNTVWMGLFFALAIVAWHVAPDRLVASFTVTKLIRLYIVFWCVANCLRLDGELWPFRLGTIGMALFMTALVVQQKYMFGMYRPHGPFDHSNSIPLYANLIMPTLMIWAMCD